VCLPLREASLPPNLQKPKFNFGLGSEMIAIVLFREADIFLQEKDAMM
jgi:hypothetical protein